MIVSSNSRQSAPPGEGWPGAGLFVIAAAPVPEPPGLGPFGVIVPKAPGVGRAGVVVPDEGPETELFGVIVGEDASAHMIGSAFAKSSSAHAEAANSRAASMQSGATGFMMDPLAGIERAGQLRQLRAGGMVAPGIAGGPYESFMQPARKPRHFPREAS